MDRKTKLFNDIVNSITLIEEFLGSINLFEEYTVDLKTKSAIERQLGIIGEAIKKIKDIDPEELIKYHSDIIGFRNILIHNYDTIDDSIVWSIIKQDLSSLKGEVLEKLNSGWPNDIVMTITKVEIADADTLLSFSKKTFYDFFGHLNDAKNMDAYAALAFTPQKILAELSNPNSDFYFAMIDSHVAGYLKLNFNDAQTEFKEHTAMEIERIYVSGEHHGKRVGKRLLNFALDIARSRQYSYVWLGVWEHNENALGFYRHNGFEVFSSHPFLLGDELQTDLLMKKSISPL